MSAEGRSKKGPAGPTGSDPQAEVAKQSSANRRLSGPEPKPPRGGFCGGPETAPDDALGIALLVARAVEQAGGRYFVGGSLASSLQGEPRATNDIDVVVELPLGRCSTFVQALGADFEADVAELRRAIASGGSYNIFYLPFVTKIDVFGLGPTPYDEIEFSRRRELAVGPAGEKLWFKSPEDTVLRKLLWFREGGSVSTKQWRDVVQVLRVSGDAMDRSYLDAWAARLGIAALLAAATREASA